MRTLIDTIEDAGSGVDHAVGQAFLTPRPPNATPPSLLPVHGRMVPLTDMQRTIGR